MRKCTLSDTKESKQIRRTVDQYGLVHDRVKAYQQAELPQSQAKRSEPVISTSTLKVVKRKPSAEFLRAADRVAVAPDSVEPFAVQRTMVRPRRPTRPQRAKEPRNTGLLSYAYAYITSSEIDSGRGPRALNGGAESTRQP